MPPYYHPDYADGGADMVRARAATTNRIRLRALGSYTLGASFSTVSAATISAPLYLAPSDITSSGASGATRQQTLASKALTLSAGDDGAGMHWAITDETDSKVLLVAPGSSDVSPLVPGGQLTSPSFVFASHLQPA